MQQFQLFLLLLPPHFTDTEPIPLCLAFLWKAAITFCCWLLPKCRSRILTAPPPPRMEKGPNAHQIWLDPSRVDVEEQSLLLRTPPLSRNSPPLSPLDCLKFSLHFQSITAVRGRKLHRSSTDPWLFFKIPSFRPPPSACLFEQPQQKICNKQNMVCSKQKVICSKQKVILLTQRVTEYP